MARSESSRLALGVAVALTLIVGCSEETDTSTGRHDRTSSVEAGDEIADRFPLEFVGTELTVDEVAAASAASATAQRFLRDNLGRMDPSGTAAVVAYSRMFSESPAEYELPQYFQAAAGLIEARRAEGRSEASVAQDGDQFAAIALAIDPEYLPPWATQLESTADHEVPAFWANFGDLNAAVFPGLACRLRPFGGPEVQLAAELAREGGLYGVTHAAIVPAVLVGQGCSNEGGLPVLDEVCPMLAEEFDEVERFLLERRNAGGESNPPAALGELPPIGQLDAASLLGLDAIICGGPKAVAVEVSRRLIEEYAPGGLLDSAMTLDPDNEVDEWHALLLTSSFLGVVSNDLVLRRVVSTGR